MPRKFTVPWTGRYNTRISKSNAPSTTTAIVGFAVVGVMIVGQQTAPVDKDERWVNCLLTKEGAEEYAVKRPGAAVNSTPAAGNVGTAILIWTGNSSSIITAFGGTNSTIYTGTTSLGAITGKALFISETFTGVQQPTILIASSDNTAWYTTAAAISTAVTFTGDTHTNTTIDNISSTTGLLVGQLITGAGIAANTRIASITSSTAIVTTVATTATASGVTITRTILAKIIDTDFPANAGYTLTGSFTTIDGFNCIMTTDGKVWSSDLNTASGWTANSFDSANDYPDIGVGLARWKDKQIAFGSESMQFFYNAGLTPFPLASVGGSSTIKLGACSANAITSMSDYVFWCGGTDKGGLTIYQYDGSVTRISTPEQDFQLVLSGTASISLTAMRFYGKSFVLVNAAQTTYVYCLEDKRWHEWIGDANLWSRCVGLSVGNQILTYSISNESTSGKVYVYNPETLTFQDDGATFTASIQSMNDDSKTNYRKFYDEFRLDADIEPVASIMTLSVSDDDFQSFEVIDSIDLSSPQKITRLGSSSPGNWNRRAWKLTNSSNAAFRIRSADYWADVGTA